ncbi:hypothetical protein XU18_4366 [Perkinsela sp. CCAP 1560/4]|nr:hypothetical protein XU18_4592 [Perkinsela sp. CCAP 1560/4]KNH04359.1 hypothetical protein XU18_4366 [Perkinsela sp. CCAP 1560/4]|eukprot:KNH04096.1 hypothetical protein XU18_4592 [Perkinsela sp. CCAP 1560/4]
MFRPVVHLSQSSTKLRAQLTTLQSRYESLREEAAELERTRCARALGSTHLTTASVKQLLSQTDQKEVSRLETELEGKRKELRTIENKVAYKIIERNTLLDG